MDHDVENGVLPFAVAVLAGWGQDGGFLVNLVARGPNASGWNVLAAVVEWFPFLPSAVEGDSMAVFVQGSAANEASMEDCACSELAVSS